MPPSCCSVDPYQVVIKLAKYPVFHKRSKHIAIKYNFIREKAESGEFNFEFVRTLATAADLLGMNRPRS